jgi:hypothetical protein
MTSVSSGIGLNNSERVRDDEYTQIRTKVSLRIYAEEKFSII